MDQSQGPTHDPGDASGLRRLSQKGNHFEGTEVVGTLGVKVIGATCSCHGEERFSGGDGTLAVSERISVDQRRVNDFMGKNGMEGKLYGTVTIADDSTLASGSGTSRACMCSKGSSGISLTGTRGNPGGNDGRSEGQHVREDDGELSQLGPNLSDMVDDLVGR
jgi:hypothetical protein